MKEDEKSPDIVLFRHDSGAGVRGIIGIPYSLTEGIHLQRDLPNLIAPLKKKYTNLEIEVGRSLDDHPQMPSIILGPVREVVGETKAAR